MSDEEYKNSELGIKLAETLHNIKEDIYDYLSDNLPKSSKKPRVVFTIKDRHVQDDKYLAWRYWIGLDESDLNNFGEHDLKKKVYAFLGHGDNSFRDNYQPCTFEQGISVSGKVLPGKNWMFLQTPENLCEVNQASTEDPKEISQAEFDRMMMAEYYSHAKFDEEKFRQIIKIFVSS